MLVSQGPAAEEPSLGAVRVQLAHGDEIEGTLLPSEGGRVKVRHPVFAQPLTFETEAIRKLELPGGGEAAGGGFRASLFNGDVLHGNLAALDEKEVLFRSPRHGDIRIRREELKSLTRLDNPSLLYLGPGGLKGWSALPDSRDRFSWQAVPGGGLYTGRWGDELFRRAGWPERVEVDLELQSSRQVEFSLAMESRVDGTLRLETWGDALVLTRGSDFEWLADLGKDQQVLGLRAFWNRRSGQFVVFDNKGSQLGAMRFPTDAAHMLTGGFYLRNKGMDLALNRLTIRQWNGELPREELSGHPSLRLSDGRLRDERVLSLESESGAVRLASGELVSMTAIDTLFFEGERRFGLSGQRATVELGYPDGTRISGTFLGVDEAGVSVQTPYARDAFTARMEGLRSIVFPYTEAREPDLEADQLWVRGRSWHGKLAAGREGSGSIGWQPLGALEGVDLSLEPGERGLLRRGGGRVIPKPEGDRLFLRTGEILSCRVEAVDEEWVTIRTGWSETTRVPAAAMQALEFGEGRLQLNGFGDRAWRERNEAEQRVRLEPARLFLDGGTVAHPSILRGDEVRFRVSWENLTRGAITVGLFGNGELDADYPLELSLSFMGNRLWVAASESTTGELLSNDQVMIGKGIAQVVIRHRDEVIGIDINGRGLMEFDFAERERGGNGLAFRSGGPWFNTDAGLSRAVVDRFEVRSSTGLLSAIRVEDGLKEQVLATPRFRRSLPDSHVLVGGNGDVLRGRLRSISATEIRFVSRLREFKFPRSRVAAVIEMRDPESVAPEALDPGELYVYGVDGSALRMKVGAMSLDRLTGDSPILGACQVDLDRIRQIEIGAGSPLQGELTYANWVRRPAVEPELPSGDAPLQSGEQLIGQMAPRLSLPLMGGGRFDLREQRGSAVVLEFWASWSGPSRDTLDELQKAFEGVDPSMVTWMTVNLGEAPSVVGAYLQRLGWEMPVALDVEEKSRAAFQFEALPHAVVIDPDGKVVWVQGEYRPGRGMVLRRTVDEMLRERSADPPGRQP